MEGASTEAFCRICYSDINPITRKNDLIAPCNCTGSVKHVHYACLKMWRMKGKAFGKMKHCEQCHGTYNVPGEPIKYSFLVSIATIFTIIFGHFLSAIFFQNLVEAITFLVNEITQNQIIEFYEKDIRFDKIYHISCLMLSITLYKLFTRPKFFIIFNYIFTFWRLAHFNFKMDNFLFGCFTLYFLKQIYEELYENIDGLFYYLMNLNWEKSDLKTISN